MGTIMHKGEMYGGGGSNSNLITLTWAEYEALPAADKADLNKYYYITDLNTGSDLVTQISNPADNQFLMYDSSKGLWVNHAGGLYQYIPLTEDEYNALTTEQKNDPSKLYYVTDVDVVNANIDDTTISTEKVWSSKKVSDEVDEINSNLKKIHILTGYMNSTVGQAIQASYPTGLNASNSMVVEATFEASEGTGVWYPFNESGVSYGNCIQTSNSIIVGTLRSEAVSKPYRLALVEI